jgi:hypothetical protein
MGMAAGTGLGLGVGGGVAATEEDHEPGRTP